VFDPGTRTASIAAVQVHLVRHAHAGTRSAWSGDDTDRPLSRKGRDQAVGLIDVLGRQPEARLLSSPAVRCVETLEPLAEAEGLDIATVGWLAEGNDPDEVLDRLLRLEAATVVACSHGDVIPAVLRRVAASGADVERGVDSQKGSTWTLELDGNRITTARYHPPVRATSRRAS